MPSLDPAHSEHIIRKHALLAAGAGLIPVPLADLAAVTGVQLQMIGELSSAYGIPFSRHRTKSILSALVGSVASREIASMGLSAALKSLPGIGTMLGAASMPLASAALTYAIGTVFREHFEVGGGIEDLSLERSRSVFRQHFDQGKKIVADLLAKKSGSAPSIATPPASAEPAPPATPPAAPAPSAPATPAPPAAAREPLKIYCILKPNIGKYGKVYLKTYMGGRRPEKYLGTIDEFKIRYGVENLETVKDRIIEDHREMFAHYVDTRTKEADVYESETSEPAPA
jgi:uncharacterized protein (DUF697 family)